MYIFPMLQLSAVLLILILILAKMLGLYTHLICWLCDLHMQCGSHICSAIYTYTEFMLSLSIDNCYTHLQYIYIYIYIYIYRHTQSA